MFFFCIISNILPSKKQLRSMHFGAPPPFRLFYYFKYVWFLLLSVCVCVELMFSNYSDDYCQVLVLAVVSYLINIVAAILQLVVCPPMMASELQMLMQRRMLKTKTCFYLYMLEKNDWKKKRGINQNMEFRKLKFISLTSHLSRLSHGHLIVY